jgi:hypothetical protein
MKPHLSSRDKMAGVVVFGSFSCTVFQRASSPVSKRNLGSRGQGGGRQAIIFLSALRGP